MSAVRSSYITLYSSADKANNAYKAQIDVDSADVSWSAAQDLQLDFNSYQFKKADDSVFDLETRFGSLEADVVPANNSAAIAALQVDLAAETVSRTSGDTANGNLITAETSARTTSDTALTASIAAEASAARAAEAANGVLITAEETARIAGDAAEQTRAVAVEASLQSQITNILSNADPAVIDSIAELLAHANAADASLLASVATLQSDYAQLRLDFDALVAQ
jgi:hypothetical protein